MVGHALSFSDLMLVTGWAKAYGENNKQEIERILFENGIDTEEPYTVEFSQHRNLRGEIVSCERYIGEERSCKEWLKSGAASWEAEVESCGLDLRIQLKTMSKMLNTGDFIDYAQKHGIQSDN